MRFGRLSNGIRVVEPTDDVGACAVLGVAQVGLELCRRGTQLSGCRVLRVCREVGHR